MTLHIDPEEIIRFKIPVEPTSGDAEDDDKDDESEIAETPTFLLRPLRAREEHAVLDMQKAWARYLYVLERCLVGWEDFPKGPEFSKSSMGGAAEMCIKALPILWRSAISNHLMNLITISEEDLEK